MTTKHEHSATSLSVLLKRLSWNSSILLLSGGIAGVLGLATLAALARAFTPATLGVFVLLTAYAQIVSRLAGFQSWQPVISFAGRDQFVASPRLSSLLSCALTLDAAGAIFAALLTVVAAPVALSLMNVSASSSIILALAAATITTLAGVPTAVLRLADKHYLYALHTVYTSALRLALIAGTAIGTRDLQLCIYAWATAQVLTNFSLFGLGYAVLKQQGIASVRPTLSVASFSQFPGLTRAFVTTNLIQTAKILRDIDVLIIGGLLGAESAGVFRIAKQVGDIVIKATDPLMVAVFPEFARVQGNTLSRRLLAATTVIMALGGLAATLLFWAFGPLLLMLAFGPNYQHVASAALICVLAASVRAASQPAASALLANRNSTTVLNIVVGTGLLYIGLLILSPHIWDGFGRPELVLLCVSIAMTTFLMWRGLALANSVHTHRRNEGKRE